MSNNTIANFHELFSSMESFISSKTVVGEAINIGDVIIVPLVDVSFGMGAGGADAGKKDKEKDKPEKDTNIGAGAVGGKITPSAVLVVVGGNVQLVNVKDSDSVNKLIDMVPGILSKIDFGAMFNKKGKKEDEDNDISEDYDANENFEI